MKSKRAIKPLPPPPPRPPEPKRRLDPNHWKSNKRPCITKYGSLERCNPWFLWKPCSKCKMEFRRQNGWKAFTAPYCHTPGLSDGIRRYLCEECAPTYEIANQYFLDKKWLGPRPESPTPSPKKKDSGTTNHRLSLDREDFKRLVRGGVVDKKNVRIILNDIGWDLMIEEIEAAKYNRETCITPDCPIPSDTPGDYCYICSARRKYNKKIGGKQCKN